MKNIRHFICIATLWAISAGAQSPVTLTIDTKAAESAIPDDFVGLSFGMKALLPDKEGNHLFSATNTALITLFRNIGLRHLRLGGTTVESPTTTPIPGTPEIDDLFAFAQAAGVNKIIYSLRLLESDPRVSYIPTNVAIAKYITARYSPLLESFSIGNEPDRRQIFKQDLTISNFSSYLAKWRKVVSAIHDAAPSARFSGPDGGSGNVSWTTRFAKAEKDSGILESVTEHYYAGGKGKGLEAGDAIESMLSPEWNRQNQKLCDKTAAVVMSNKLSFRFTEANDHYSGGVENASDTYAGALWALDFLHWWAAHGAKGVDFHNTQWVPSDVIRPDATDVPTINPKAYSLKMFDLGGHGIPAPLTMANPGSVNVTAYSFGDGSNLLVTVINKEHGANARAAGVTIVADGFSGPAGKILLTISSGDVASKTGVTLGGDTITSGKPWRGKWSPFPPSGPGRYAVEIPAATAAVIRIPSH